MCVCVCREKVRDIEELRRAVKQEAGELEKQLNELAHHYDDSLKMVTLSYINIWHFVLMVAQEES